MKKTAATALCLLILLTGCGTASPAGSREYDAEDPSVSGMETASSVASVLSPVQPVSAAGSKGTGSIVMEGSASLSEQQQEILLSYMNLFYNSLAGLSAADPASLFAADAAEQAQARRNVWQVMAEVRKAQQVDLSLTGFSYELTCTNVEIRDDGDLSVSIRENSIQNFAAFPGVSSESMNVVHRFVLTNTADGWRLRSHSQMDSANRLAGGRMGSRDFPDAETDTAAQRQALLDAHTQNIALRRQQSAGADPAATWQYDYDRTAAVAYATQWAGSRNAQSWPVYDRNGGNCANFTSQCLYAGGIPMDYSGTAQWKWYGDTPNTAQTATGRSAAWSGVNEFYTYVNSNTGYGMVATADSAFCTGEAGDLIQLGYGDSWRHVVIITDVILDDAGNTVDYLVASNTADLRRFPVSAYLYPQQRLIRIHGWNGGTQF